MIQRSGDVAIFMLPDVQRKTIEPILRSVITPGTLVNTDEYHPSMASLLFTPAG
jgi:hypothetical protein